MIQLNPPHDEDFEQAAVDQFTLEEALRANYYMPLYVKRAELALVAAKQTVTRTEAIYEKYESEMFLKAEGRTANDKKAMALIRLMEDQFEWEEAGVKKSCSYQELVAMAQAEYSMAQVHFHYQQNREKELVMRLSTLKEQMKRI